MRKSIKCCPSFCIGPAEACFGFAASSSFDILADDVLELSTNYSRCILRVPMIVVERDLVLVIVLAQSPVRHGFGWQYIVISTYLGSIVVQAGIRFGDAERGRKIDCFLRESQILLSLTSIQTKPVYAGEIFP